jgi:hypothetical protein
MPPANEVLYILKPWEAEFREVQQALERPKCRQPGQYEIRHYDEERAFPERVMFNCLLIMNGMLRPKLVSIAAKGDAQAFVDGIVSQLLAGDLFSGDCMYVLGHRMRMGTHTQALRTLQNCIPTIHLNDGQLLSLQRQLERVRMSDVKKMFQEELVRECHLARHVTPEQIKEWLEGPFRPQLPDRFAGALRASYPTLMVCRPNGWRLMDAAIIAEFVHEEVLPCIDDVKGTILPSRAARIDTAAERLRESAGGLSLNKLHGSYWTVAMHQAAQHQAMAREAGLWCAIERFRLKHHRLPDLLEELEPEFVENLPVDPVNGLPLKYSRKDKENYLLYSIGWDCKDDAGLEGTWRGDWVWASDPRLIVNPEEERKVYEEEKAKREKERDEKWEAFKAKRDAAIKAKRAASAK